MININKEILKNLNPCADRWKNYLDHYDSFSGSFEEFLLLDKITIADKVFVIKKMIPTKYLVKWTQKCSESVAHLKGIPYDIAARAAYAASRADAAYTDADDVADAAARAHAAIADAVADAAYADAVAVAVADAATDAAYADADAVAVADAAYKDQCGKNFSLLIEIIKENDNENF